MRRRYTLDRTYEDVGGTFRVPAGLYELSESVRKRNETLIKNRVNELIRELESIFQTEGIVLKDAYRRF
jgi:hypothetical protein